MDIERRRFPRFGMVKLAFVKAGSNAHGGLTRDISEGGAFVDFQMPLGRVEHAFARGSAVELHFDDGLILHGRAQRIEPEAIAILFDASERKVLQELIAQAEYREAATGTVHRFPGKRK